MKLLWVVLFIFLNSANSFSFDQSNLPEVSILQIDGEGKKPTKWNYKVQPIWEYNWDGAYEFYWGISLYVPAKSPIQNVQAQNALIGFSKDAQVDKAGMIPLFIKMTSLRDTFIVSFKDDERVQFEIDLVFNKLSLSGEACDEFFLKIVPNKKNESRDKSFFLAYRCDKSEDGVALSVTAPQEVSWAGNTLSESKGKDKRWKTFEVNTQSSSTGKKKLGELKLNFESSESKFDIIVDQLAIQRDASKFRLGLGLINMNITTDGKSDALSKPVAYVRFEQRPLAPEFVIGGEGVASLPSVSSKSYFAHTEALGYLGYTFGQHKSLSVEPRLYGCLLDGISQNLQFYYSLNIMAVGVEVKYKLSDYSKISFETLQMSLPNQFINSMRLSWAFLNDSRQTGWGLFLGSQSAGSNLQTKNKGIASQKFAGIFMDF